MKIYDHTGEELISGKKIVWMITALFFAIVFFSFYYIDLKSLTIWSTNIWDTLLISGNIRNYYYYSALNIYGLHHEMVGSDLLIMIPWAIWNLPIWAIQYFGHIAIVDSPLMLLYSKSFLLVITYAICRIIHKIFVLGNKQSSSQLGIFLFCSSPFLMYEVAYAGQNDIIVIYLYLNGIYQLMKGDRKKFLLLAALSIACKPFFLFSYIALILLIEKKLHKLVLYFMSSLSFVLIQKILFMGAPMYKESLSYGPMAEVMTRILSAKLDRDSISISVFLLALFGIFFIAYLTDFSKFQGDKTENLYERIMYILYFSMVPFVCYCALVRDSFYRPIYIFVIWSILIGFRKDYFRINILLEIIYTAAFLGVSLFEEYFFWPGYRIGVSEVPRALTIPERISRYVTGDLSIYVIICNTMCLFALFVLMIIMHPRFHVKNNVFEMETEKYLPIIRLCIYALPVLITLYVPTVS